MGLLLAALAGALVASPPNVLIVLTDDQGWGDTGYNCGQPGSVAYSKRNMTSCPRTPHIDGLATGPHAVLFHRFYSGAGVCSPTRASVLTGRNNKRSCINSALPCDHMATEADGCSQGPGLAKSEFTVAKAAAKVGMNTIHLGKWHMGDLFEKKVGKYHGHSNPSDHGFVEWYTSQAQLPTSTPNCGCFPPDGWQPPDPESLPPSWSDPNIAPNVDKFRHNHPGQDCIIAGGAYVNESFVCSTYWRPDPSDPLKNGGVSNITTKIVGDDGAFIVQQLDAFVGRSVAAEKKWLAVAMLHYIHLPHPAMPKYYADRLDSGDPDYVGTLQQLDDAIGDIVQSLKHHQVFNDTLFFYTADNGAHCNESPASVACGGINVGRSTGGVRGCKASLWEGGIRVPGWLVWPSRINTHRETWVPAVTHDFLPTIMEALGVASDNRNFELDGTSLMPFITASSAEAIPSTRLKPIGFWWGNNKAWIDNDLKIVDGSLSPGQGCVAEAPWRNASANIMPLLFNLTADHAESVDLKESSVLASRYESMQSDFEAWQTSVVRSADVESHCQAHSGPSPVPGPAPAPSTKCTFTPETGCFGGDKHLGRAASKEACCALCLADPTCTVAVFQEEDSACHIKKESKPGCKKEGYWACRARPH